VNIRPHSSQHRIENTGRERCLEASRTRAQARGAVAAQYARERAGARARAGARSGSP